MANEFTALDSIPAPGTTVFGYRRGDAVGADVVESWGLVVGQHVCEGDLSDDAPGAVPMQRPGPEANRADWEAWAVANGMDADVAAEAPMEDLQAEGTPEADSADRPADSAKKAEWVDFAVSRGLDRETAEGKTKAELQDWVAAGGWSDSATAGDSVALAATEAQG
jgi:hypothetical protein